MSYMRREDEGKYAFGIRLSAGVRVNSLDL